MVLKKWHAEAPEGGGGAGLAGRVVTSSWLAAARCARAGGARTRGWSKVCLAGQREDPLLIQGRRRTIIHRDPQVMTAMDDRKAPLL